MKPAVRSMLTGIVAFTFAAPVPAQFGGFSGPVAMPPQFRVGPATIPTRENQPAVAQPPPGSPAAQVGALTGLPSFATITSTPREASSFSSQGRYDGIAPSYYPNPYNPYINYGPVGGALMGLADLTRSYGDYIKDYQQARLMNQDVERSRLYSQRQLVEQWLWMSSLQPTPADIRQRNLEQALALARMQAPLGTILTGKTLNDLLGNLMTEHGKGARGPAVPLDEETLKLINVSPKFGRNIALIRNGKISWPVALRGEAFTAWREKIDGILEDAINRARINGSVDAALLKDLSDAYKGLETALERAAPGMTMSQFISAQRYLTSLGEALRTLEDPDVGNYFNNTYVAQGKTVSDLVNYMKGKGLVFVGALPGHEAAYRALYNALIAYDSQVSGSPGQDR